ncbi:MAG: DNA-binding protein [Candidatus Micrarchaeota archaeon]
MPEQQEDANERIAKMQKARELEIKKKMVLKQLVDAAAYERVMNIRLANPELYEQIISLLLYLYQNRQLKGKISEEKLLALLGQITAKKREPTFEIRKK